MALELSGLARAAKLGLIDSEGRVERAEFYLTNLETEEEIQLCQIPESVRVKTTASFRSYNIVERGEIKLPKGEQLTQISWQGILPGAGVLLYPGITHAAWDNPEEIIRDLERWKSDGDKIKLLVTETPINLEVYVKDFGWEASGGMGNYLIEHSEEVFNMLALEWNMNDALQARFEDGRNEEREAVAIKLIHMGLNFTDIQKATDLPFQRLEQLANDNRDNS